MYSVKGGFKLSFYTRVYASEFLFGGGDYEEENIGASILDSLLKVRLDLLTVLA